MMSTEIAIVTLALHGFGDPSGFIPLASSDAFHSRNLSPTSRNRSPRTHHRSIPKPKPHKLSISSVTSNSSSSSSDSNPSSPLSSPRSALSINARLSVSGSSAHGSESTESSPGRGLDRESSPNIDSRDSDDDDDFKYYYEDDCQTYETALRGIKWRKYLGLEVLKRFTSPMLFTQLIEAETEDSSKIRRDINRTFPKHAFFQKQDNIESLYNILHAYSIYGFGYAQGLAFLAGVLRVHMGEEDAFWSLTRLLNDRFYLQYMYCHDRALTDTLKSFDYFVKLHLPRLYEHFVNNDMTATVYAAQWFLTLFAYKLSFHQISVVWDLVLQDGIIAVYKIGLSILEHFQKKLLKRSFETSIKVFNSVHTIPLSVITRSRTICLPDLTAENVCLSRYSTFRDERVGTSLVLIGKVLKECSSP